MTDRYVPARILYPLVTLFARQGVRGDDLLARAGLSQQLLSDPNALLSARDYDALSVALQDSLGDPALALHIGEIMRTDMLDSVGLLSSTAANLREALNLFLRFKPLVNPCGDLIIEEEGAEVRLLCHISPEQGLSGRFHYAEMYFSTLLIGARTLSNRDIRIHRVEFTHDANPWLAECQRVFGADTVFLFAAKENVMVLDRNILDETLPSHMPAIHQQVTQLAERQLAELPQKNTTASAVLDLLEQHIGAQLLDIDEVARLLNTTPRTLQRHLRDEDNTFKALRDHMRFRHAKRLLCNLSLSVDHIAERLGFSEPASFYRAFKGWSSLSPGEYRDRLSSHQCP